MTAAIVAAGLAKDYGQGHGLLGLDLEVPAGEVFGYLGPNGAGKTTTIRLLMGMIRPTRGRATILGLDCQRDSIKVKRVVGYLPGELPQFGGLTGAEIVAQAARLRGGFDRARVRAIAERFELDLGRHYREYSRGNKQKLGILLAFAHRPPVLVLDEPSGGLDPLHQQSFQELVAEARADGATVLFSSHVLSEVEDVCDRVAIIRGGRLVRIAELDELREMRLRHVDNEFSGEAGSHHASAVSTLPGVSEVMTEARHLRFVVRGPFGAVMSVLDGGDVVTVTSHEPTLEEIFLSYYEESPVATQPTPAG
jgi:polyether ionophore transport system ATP-binding protein